MIKNEKLYNLIFKLIYNDKTIRSLQIRKTDPSNILNSVDFESIDLKQGSSILLASSKLLFRKYNLLNEDCISYLQIVDKDTGKVVKKMRIYNQKDIMLSIKSSDLVVDNTNSENIMDGLEFNEISNIGIEKDISVEAVRDDTLISNSFVLSDNLMREESVLDRSEIKKKVSYKPRAVKNDNETEIEIEEYKKEINNTNSILVDKNSFVREDFRICVSDKIEKYFDECLIEQVEVERDETLMIEQEIGFDILNNNNSLMGDLSINDILDDFPSSFEFNSFVEIMSNKNKALYFKKMLLMGESGMMSIKQEEGYGKIECKLQ